jgi:translation elongation factor EF-Ts
MKPPYILREEVPKDLIEKEKAILKKDIKATKDDIVNKILDGKLKKFY